MSGGTGKEREERAVDALLVSALRLKDNDGTDVDPERLPQLTEEEKAAMKALGSNFIQRLLAGERPLTVTEAPKEDCPDKSDELTLAGSGADTRLNRAEEVDEQTQQELDEREREILQRKARERKEGGGDAAP
jgi:hypothetical protein